MLKTLSKTLCSIALMVLATTVSAHKGDQWLTNMDQAQRIAKAEGKDIFMFFTGSDWCSGCIRLDREVLSTEEFLLYAKDNLVLVDLDFPQSNNIITNEQREHNAKWQGTLKPCGFPTVYLTDASANAYAMTGYQGGGAVKYVEHLKNLRADRATITELLTNAAKTSGVIRAKLLDKALSNNNAAVDNREALVSEIISLSQNNDDALYNKYRSIKGGQGLIQDMNEKLTLNNSAEDDLAALLVLFDKYSYLKEGHSLTMLMQNMALRYSKTGKQHEGIAFLNKLHMDANYPAKTRQASGVMKAFLTAETGDIDKAITCLDKALALLPESTIGQSRDHIMQELEHIMTTHQKK